MTRPLPAVLLACLLPVPGIAAEARGTEADLARDLTQRGEILPLERVLEKTTAEYPGRVIEIELEQEHGRYIYEFEIVDSEGRVWELEVDAATGAVLEREQEDN